MIVVIVEGVLCVLLAYIYYKVATGNKVTPLLKWTIIISSIGVFAFDKIKLFLFLLSLGVVWLIKHKKSKSNEFT